MRTFATMLLTAAVVLIGAAPARACLWDRDTVRHERQFKALYPDTPPPAYPGDGAVEAGSTLLSYGGSGAGILLLAARLPLSSRGARGLR
jgi:hypothetical protein